MKKTRIGRDVEKKLLEIIYDNCNIYKEDLQEIIDDCSTLLKTRTVNKEEVKEIYEIYEEVISNITFMNNRLELIEKELNKIENLEETELKDD